jgi:Domain of unknown function (DUF4926)
MSSKSQIKELDVVALLADIPDENLVRGQVGTVVDLPGNGTALVEFSDNIGMEDSIVRIQTSLLLRLAFEKSAS